MENISDVFSRELIAAIKLGFYAMAVGTTIGEIIRLIIELLRRDKASILSGAKRTGFVLFGMICGASVHPTIIQDALACWSLEVLPWISYLNMFVLGCLVFVTSKIAYKAYAVIDNSSIKLAPKSQVEIDDESK